MASITKRTTSSGKITYRARITLKGHPRISQTFTKRRAAERWAASTEEAMRAGRYQPDSKSEQHTVGDLIARYRDVKIPLLARQCEANRILGWWLEELGENLPLARITPERLSRSRDRLLTTRCRRSGKFLKPDSMRCYFVRLSAAITAAQKEWYWMESNPCRSVVMPEMSRGRCRFLDEEDDEKTRLLTACQASKCTRLYPLVVMALASGGRQSELLNLRWRDLDLREGTALLHTTKNGDSRTLAITGLARKVLAEWKQAGEGNGDLVFATSSAKRASFPRLAWRNAVKAADLTDFRFHDLRHTFASWLAMSGATLSELAEALGHRTLDMVMRYAHLTPAHTRSIVCRMTDTYLAA